MRIALIIDRFLPEKGGRELYVQLLARNLSARGHTVTIFSRHFARDIAEDSRIFRHRIYVPIWPAFIKILLFASRCKRDIEREIFDITHDVGHIVGADIFNPHGGVEQVWLKRYFASYDRAAYRMFKKIQRFLSPKEWAVILLQKRQYLSDETHRIIAISSMIKSHIHIHYPEIPENKISLVQNPADLSKFNPKNRLNFREIQRKSLHLRSTEITILFVGNNYRLKGLSPLLKSLVILDRLNAHDFPFRLLVIGHGNSNLWGKFSRKIGVEKRVTFLGSVKDMEKIYAAADIFVLPTYYDSAALVILEAMASGLPVVTSRWNGVSSLIDAPDAGMVLENNDNPEEIARAVYSYFPIEKRKIALKMSPQKVSVFSLEHHVDKILEIYQEVIKEKAHG